MSATREIIAAQILKDHPNFIVKDYPSDAPDHFGASKPVQVSVFRSSLTNGTYLTHTHIVELMIGSGSESDLDGYLDDVLESLERVPGITWKDATRTVFGTDEQPQKFNGYRIADITASSNNIYRELIASEGAPQ